MKVTEQQRHQLFVWFEEHMGPELAPTMMNLTPPAGWWEVASKDDLRQLEARIETRFEGLVQRFEHLELKIDASADRLRSELFRTFGTWLFASQAAVIAAVSVLLSLD